MSSDFVANPAAAISNHPFRREGLARRGIPFAVAAIIAEASLALPPGPSSSGYTALSAGLLVGVCAAMVFLPWQRLPAWSTVLVPVAYVWSGCALILATGTSASGVGVVILIPLLWSVLFHSRWNSFIVVASIVLVEVITSLTPDRVPDAVLLRSVLLWAVIGLLVTVTTHELRIRLRRNLIEREGMLRRTSGLASAAVELTAMLSCDDVLMTAARMAAEVVSPAGTPGRRAQYTRIVGDRLHVVAQFDENGENGESSTLDIPLSELPNLANVMATGFAVNQPIVMTAAGPAVQQQIASMGLTHAVYVPVYSNGVIDGVLSVATRGESITPELFEVCKTLGHITELALENARSRELLEEQATTDELTGLANRRAFDQWIARRPGRLEYCILAVDLDGLKQINDTLGHAVGDQMLIYVSGVLASTFRQGDLFARIGGDEFAGLLFQANENDGRDVAMRMLAALIEESPRGASPSVSIGIASGGPESDGQMIYAAADAAMYRAKRSGGGRFVVASRLDDDERHMVVVGG
jgi:diguanylate cyclase (GGDEF)-like protein